MTKARGTGYSGPDSTRPTQQQESDITNLGGTAPGGQTAFVGGNSQWSSSKGAQLANIPPGGQINPVRASLSMHTGLPDEAPDGSRNVPIHPGLMPGLFRTAQDANPRSPDGEAPVNDATANDGRPLSPDGKHRGESPEVPKQSRGPYRN